MFSVYRHRKVFFGIALGLLALGIVLSFTLGVELDIQFRGGSLITYHYTGELDLIEAERAVSDALGQSVTAQSTTAVSDGNTALVISVAGNEALLPSEMTSVIEALESAFPDREVALASSRLVAPFIGRETLINGLLAMLVASVLIIAYVWYSFRKISGPSAGVMALIALFHDILIAFFVFVVMRTPLNESVIAVTLTILGFSINDTIVIYDRIRENVRLTNGSLPLSDLVDLSVRQSFTRGIITSLCTFAAVGVAYVFSMAYGLTSIAEFALPMMVGIISGAFSSLFLVAPLWVAWKTRGGRTGYEA